VCASPRDWKDRVQDILDAIAEIQAFTHGRAFDSFRTDAKTLRAVELDLIVIGEAANGITCEIEEQHPRIPWSLMRAISRMAALTMDQLIDVFRSILARITGAHSRKIFFAGFCICK
jgi:uncharacterized protein with HEPN domain